MSTTKYSKIQMIGLAISTTPGNLNSIEDMSDDGYYMGKKDIAEDIRCRLFLLKSVIDQAYMRCDDNSNTLKVFVVPEFFFRGVAGVYFGASENVFKTYFSDFINSFTSQPKYKNWLFILGTLLTSEIKINKNEEPVKSLFPMGDYLLNVYNRLYPRQKELLQNVSGKSAVSLRSMLKSLDLEDEATDSLYKENYCLNSTENTAYSTNENAFKEIMKSVLDHCDETANVLVENRCYIVEGGVSDPRIIQVLKKFKSKEDFILNAVDDNYIQTITCYPKIEDKSEQKESDCDPYGIFEYEGVRFGLEICLDHGRARLARNLKMFSLEKVDVQIVVSCGMDVRSGSVITKKGGIVFNCDGEYVLDNEAENGEKSHTTLKLTEKSASETSSAVLSPYVRLEEGRKLSFSYDGDMYPCDTYQLHIYPTYPVTNK